MAIPEYDDYIAHQNALALSNLQPNSSEPETVNEGEDGRVPVPATDHFTGELPDGLDPSSLQGQTVLASAGERVTSAYGSYGLDPISRATVLQRERSMSIVPRREVNQVLNPYEENTSNHVASEAPARNAAQENGSEGDAVSSSADTTGMLLSLSTLQNRSLNCDSVMTTSNGAIHSSSMESCRRPGRNYNHLLDNSSAAKVPSCAPSTQNDEVSTFPETGPVQDNQEESTSGFESYEGAAAQFNEENGVQRQEQHAESHCNTFNRYLPLHVSEAGQNAMKALSGRQSVALFPAYSGFIARILSYPDHFVLGEDIYVNRDLLALSGFFYSDHKTVTCFHCGCSPRVWGDGREPVTEHRMLSPYCKAVAVASW